MSEVLVFRIKKWFPFLICLYLVLLSQIPDIRFFFIPLVYIPIFYFSVFRPKILNEYMLFLLGLFADFITDTPFGLYSFLFVLLFFVSRLNRLFLKELSFKSLWVLFIGFSGFMLLLQMFLFALCESSVVYTKFLFQHFIALVFFFPIGFWLCDLTNNWIGTEA